MHSVPVIVCFKTHVSILYFRHPFDYQIIYLINTSSASISTSVDKLIHHIMEFILFMTPASHTRVYSSTHKWSGFVENKFPPTHTDSLVINLVGWFWV